MIGLTPDITAVTPVSHGVLGRAACREDRKLQEREIFGKFVNRPYAGVLEPARFDAAAATPILLRWLPEIQQAGVKEAIVRHLETKAARDVATDALIDVADKRYGHGSWPGPLCGAR